MAELFRHVLQGLAVLEQDAREGVAQARRREVGRSNGRRNLLGCQLFSAWTGGPARLFSLVASGQIRLRRLDGWKKVAAC